MTNQESFERGKLLAGTVHVSSVAAVGPPSRPIEPSLTGVRVLCDVCVVLPTIRVFVLSTDNTARSH